MNKERLMKVLLAPLRTEKSHSVAEKSNHVTFKVLPSATKAEIKQAVKLLFKVDVVSVQVVNTLGKRTRFGRVQGKHSDWKKAYIRLASGQDINFVGAEGA